MANREPNKLNKLAEIVVAICISLCISLLTISTVPWWWEKLFPPKPIPPTSPAISTSPSDGKLFPPKPTPPPSPAISTSPSDNLSPSPPPSPSNSTSPSNNLSPSSPPSPSNSTSPSNNLSPSSPPSPSNSTPASDNLSTDVGVDYTQLRNLLRDGKWRMADFETANVMLKVSKREQEVWLRQEDIENFSCTDLRTIDQLWVKYSNGRFGFSVQKRIWEEVGGTPEYNDETKRKMGEEVGWRRNGKWLSYSDLTFTTQAPSGQFPSDLGWSGVGVAGVRGLPLGFRLPPSGLPLFSRVKTCKIQHKVTSDLVSTLILK